MRGEGGGSPPVVCNVIQYVTGRIGGVAAVGNGQSHRASTPGKVGRQMQTWVRFVEGWRVVAAHVSVIDEPRS